MKIYLYVQYEPLFTKMALQWISKLKICILDDMLRKCETVATSYPTQSYRQWLE